MVNLIKSTLPKNALYYIFILVFIFTSCNKQEIKKDNSKTVQLIYKDGKYTLLRHGKPYYIKGASGDGDFALLKQIGGNSVRTYTTENAKEILDEAQKLGLTVMLGIWIEQYSETNDFSKDRDNQIILNYVKREVLRYKDHPALLMWGIGNEVHPINPNISLWQFLDKACKMVKELDPNHPVTTSIAGYPRRNIPFMNMFLKNVDLVSFNTFGGIDVFKRKMNSPIWGYNGSYLLSEWGYHGYWAVDRTKWRSVMEPYTNSKAPRFKEIWNHYILNDSTKCLGGYVFYWGQKQEFTNSWYSLFDKKGNKTAIVDTLSSLWRNEKLDNSAPHIIKLQINNIEDYKNIVLKKSSINSLSIDFKEFDGDSISISSEIRHETSMRKDDYGIEKEPLKIQNSILDIKNNSIKFLAPSEAGFYRIYVNISDGYGNCDMANLVFKVN